MAIRWRSMACEACGLYIGRSERPPRGRARGAGPTAELDGRWSRWSVGVADSTRAMDVGARVVRRAS